MALALWLQGRSLNTGTLAAVPPALVLKLLNSFSPFMYLAPHKPLSLHQNPGEYLGVRESVLQLFKRTSGFPVVFLSHLHSWDPGSFSQPDIVGTPFPSSGALSWGARYGAGTSHSSGGPL